jgi:hypothetical protein
MATDYISGVIDYPDLIGYVRENAILEGPTLLGGIVPELEVEDLVYELQNQDVSFVNTAKYRAWDTAPPLGKRAAFTTLRGEIAPLGLSMTLNERELKNFQAFLRGDETGNLNDIYDDARATGLACRVRFEAAIADLLQDGVVTINENGLIAVADFGVPGAHLVTAGTLWSDRATSTPLTNLLAWEVIYRTNNGGLNPDAWIVSSEVFGDLMFNAQIRSYNANNGTTPAAVGAAGVDVALRLAGVQAPIVTFDGMIPNASGVATPTLPVRSVIGFRQGFASLAYGTTPSAQLMATNGDIDHTEAAGIVCYVEQEIRPARVITTSEAVGLPILRDPKALFRATV